MRRNDIVFLDIDTQVDFITPSGGLYVKGAEEIVENLKRLTDFAQKEGILIVSTADAHTEDDQEFREYPPHCVAGTPGQKKIPETLLPDHIIVKDEPNETMPADWDRSGQIIFEKDTLNAFSGYYLSNFIKNHPAPQVAIYGVTLDICISYAIDGVFNIGKQVILIADATKALDEALGAKVVESVKNRGGRITTTDELISNIFRHH